MSPLRTDNLLTFLNASLAADIIIILLFFLGAFGTIPSLMKWYTELRLSAVIADTLILVIGLILTSYIYNLINIPYNFFAFTSLFVVLQIIHDILFYVFFTNIPTGFKVFDIFKKYAKDQGISAIKGDSLMIVITAVLTHFLNMLNFKTNLNVLIGLSYILPYVLYLK